MTPEQIRHARDLLTRPENTVVFIAKLLGVSRNTIYKYVPELKEGRPALAAAAAPALPRPAEPQGASRCRGLPPPLRGGADTPLKAHHCTHEGYLPPMRDPHIWRSSPPSAYSATVCRTEDSVSSSGTRHHAGARDLIGWQRKGAPSTAGYRVTASAVLSHAAPDPGRVAHQTAKESMCPPPSRPQCP
jgi:hypothetical protein